MEKTVRELRRLGLMIRRHCEAACDLNKRQIKLCKETLVGKCFRVRGKSDWRLINGERYPYYIRFIRLVESLHDDDDFCLEGIMVSFVDADAFGENGQIGGVRVVNDMDTATAWLYYLENAREISRDEFERAKRRAIGYIVDELSEEIKGEAVLAEGEGEDGEDYAIIDEGRVRHE